MKTLKATFEERVTALTCNRCGRHASCEGEDVMEFQEFLQIDYKAGYASVFPDESRITGDFCQHCVQDLLGPWLRIQENAR